MKTIKELDNEDKSLNSDWVWGYKICKKDVLGLIDELMKGCRRSGYTWYLLEKLKARITG